MKGKTRQNPPAGLLPGEGTRPLVVGILDGRMPHLEASATARSEGADVLELRIDGLERPARRPESLVRILAGLRGASGLPLIATFRHPSEGGLAEASDETDEAERADILAAAAEEADLVDVEIGERSTALRVLEAAHRNGKGVILSHHDMAGVPRRAHLVALARRAARMGGDMFKIAGFARDRADAARLLLYCRECRFPRRIVIAMGPAGSITRVAGFLFGSALTYGYLGRSVAPGQLSLRDLAAEVRRYYPS